MAKHYFQITFQVPPQSRSTFQEALGGVVKAYRETMTEAEIRVLGSFIGEGNDIVLEIGLNSLGEMDSWLKVPEAVVRLHGDARGQSLLDNFAKSITSSHSRVLSEFVIK